LAYIPWNQTRISGEFGHRNGQMSARTEKTILKVVEFFNTHLRCDQAERNRVK
jgi:ribosomal protein L37AE/L43A